MSAKGLWKVWELNLPAYDKLVLAKMADRADDEGGSIFESIGTVAALCSVSPSTVHRVIRRAKKIGLLEVVQKGGGRKLRGDGGGISTIYRMDWDRGLELLGTVFAAVATLDEVIAEIDANGQLCQRDTVYPVSRDTVYPVTQDVLGCHSVPLTVSLETDKTLRDDRIKDAQASAPDVDGVDAPACASSEEGQEGETGAEKVTLARQWADLAPALEAAMGRSNWLAFGQGLVPWSLVEGKWTLACGTRFKAAWCWDNLGGFMLAVLGHRPAYVFKGSARAAAKAHEERLRLSREPVKA